MSSREKRSYTIKSVDNALMLLQTLGEEEGDLSLGDLSGKLGLNKNILFRLMATFEQRGFIERGKKTGSYRIGVSAYEVGQKLLLRSGLLRKVKPVMESLARECDEAVYLSVPAGQEILMLEMVDTTRPIRIAPMVGQRFPLLQTAAGLVVAAFGGGQTGGEHEVEKVQAFPSGGLGAITEYGAAIDLGGLGDGATSLAVPLFNAQGNAVASLSLVGPQFRLTEDMVQRDLLPRLRAAGQAASSQLGYLGYLMADSMQRRTLA